MSSVLAKSFDSRLLIRREKQAACLKAIHAAQSSPEYDPEIDQDRSAGEQLAEVFEESGWRLSFDAEGNVTGATLLERDMDGLALIQNFSAAAPFVEAGSFVDLWVEYEEGSDERPNMRMTFNGRELLWQNPTNQEV